MPERFGNRYVVKRELGRGNMGRVYLAWDERLHRDVALKVIDLGMEESPELRVRERFEREAVTAGQLHSTNIVVVYDIADERDSEFIVMEYLDGDDLKRIINEKRPLSLVRKLEIIAQTCDGLHCAHKEGIIHRDVKPANIMVLKDTGVVKLVDFGIARIGVNPFKSMVLMTPAYSSPEQLGDEDRLDARSDIFSAGIVLYELATGQHPFLARDQENRKGDVEERIKSYDPKRLSEVIRDCPPKLDDIVRRALAKSPQNRYQTAELMARDLRGLADSLKRSKPEDVDLTSAAGLKSLDEITAVLSDQDRKRKVERQMELARRSITEKNFSRALEFLARAEDLDPRNPEVGDLKRVARSGQEQEERQRLLLQLRVGIQGALNREQFTEAQSLAERARQQFPDDDQVLRLHEQAARQLQLQKRRRYVDEELQRGRDLIQQNQVEQATSSLQRALEVAPDDARLMSLLKTAQELYSKSVIENVVRQTLRDANARIDSEEFSSAIQMLEQALVRVGRSPELTALMEFAHEQQADRQEQEKRKIRRIVNEAQVLIEEDRYSEAVALLESAQSERQSEEIQGLLDLAGKRREEFELRQARQKARVAEVISRAKVLLSDDNYQACVRELKQARGTLDAPEIDDLIVKAQQRWEDFEQARERMLERAQAMLHDGRPDEALRLLDSAPKSYSNDEEFLRTYQECRASAERARENLRDELFRKTMPARPAPTPERRDSEFLDQPPVDSGNRELTVEVVEERWTHAPALRLAAALSVLMIAVTGLVLWIWSPKHPQGSVPALPPNGFVELNPIPWAEVLSVRESGGQALKVANVPGQTPLRLSLPAGNYVIEIKGPNGETKPITITVESGKPVQWHDSLAGFNADKVVDELLK